MVPPVLWGWRLPLTSGLGSRGAEFAPLPLPEPPIPPDVSTLLRTVVDFTRALAETRTAELEGMDADIEPFAAIHTDDGLTPVVLTDVREHLNTAEGLGRVASSLMARYRADAFAIANRWYASPTGDPQHPQAREVVRVIAGHASGASGAVFSEVVRGPTGPRLAGVWEAQEGSLFAL